VKPATRTPRVEGYKAYTAGPLGGLGPFFTPPLTSFLPKPDFCLGTHLSNKTFCLPHERAECQFGHSADFAYELGAASAQCSCCS